MKRVLTCPICGREFGEPEPFDGCDTHGYVGDMTIKRRVVCKECFAVLLIPAKKAKELLGIE